jgi:hypothetical protein
VRTKIHLSGAKVLGSASQWLLDKLANIEVSQIRKEQEFATQRFNTWIREKWQVRGTDLVLGVLSLLGTPLLTFVVAISEHSRLGNFSWIIVTMTFFLI